MLKRNFITPVLSGVTALGVAGAGVFYVFGSENGKPETKDSDTTVSGKLSQRVSTAAEKLGQAVKGELDYSYTGSVELDFGKVLTDKLGFDLAPVALKANSMQKGGKTETDLAVSYDSKDLVNLYLIADNDTGVNYLRCPELSDAYLSLTAEDIENALKENGVDINDLSKLLSGKGLGLSSPGLSSGTGADSDASLEKLEEMFKSIDFDALSKDFDEYVQVIKDAVPEGEKKDDITGEINGHAYDYEVETINISVKTVTDIINAVADKAKTDEVLKNELLKAGMTEEQYNKLIDSLTQSLGSLGSLTSSQQNMNLCSLDLYSYEGETVGFDVSLVGMGHVKMVSVNTDDVFAIDLSALFGGAEINAKGDVVNENDVYNGKFEFTASTKDENKADGSLTIKDLSAAGDTLTGSIECAVNAGGNSVGFVVNSDSTEDKIDISASATYNNENVFSVKVNGEKTDASDVTVPDGTIFKADKDGLEAFKKSCDIDGFMNHCKEVLGEELYNKFMEGKKNVTILDGGDADSE